MPNILLIGLDAVASPSTLAQSFSARPMGESDILNALAASDTRTAHTPACTMVGTSGRSWREDNPA
jgi:hypothetical protein